MISKYLVKADRSVKEVIQHMEENFLKAVLITQGDRELLGIFSLGDMRHFFLNGGKLSDSITVAMNKEPIVFFSALEVEEDKKHRELIIYPIINENREVINVITDEKERNGLGVSNALESIQVVIMAGGKGTRLYPYTKILPKALIPIGDYTISERIINNFQQYGCKHFVMILNHKANMIKTYFEEIDKEYRIDFEKESKFLGTGGGLALLKGKINNTFFLSNCDILIDADLECIYKTHKKEKNKITFVCAMKDVVIPYGIIETDSYGKITEIKEKPEFSFLTNTGVYVVEPEVIEELVDDEFIHLPDIAKRYIEKGEKVGVFPISEKSWMDMGQFNEMDSMVKRLGV